MFSQASKFPVSKGDCKVMGAPLGLPSARSQLRTTAKVTINLY